MPTTKSKHPGGRPLAFKTAEELQKKIDAYFLSCFDIKDTTKRIKPFTITGLANFLDTSRQTLINYEDKSLEFFATIKRAKGKVEEDIENGALMSNYNPTSAIFNLKNNFGWVDKQEIDQTTKSINYNADVSDLSDDEIDNLLANT